MPIKLLIVAATGGLGSAITRHAVSVGHNVSVLVRSAESAAAKLPDTVSVVVGDASDPGILAAAVQGVDAVAVSVGAQAKAVVENAVSVVSGIAADTQPALVMVGGSPALAMEDGSSAVTGAFGGAEWAQGLRDLHLGVTFAALEASQVGRYCMACPGTMKVSEDGKPHGVHGFRPNIIDPSVAGDAATYDDVAVGIVTVAVDLVENGDASPYKNGKIALVPGENHSEM
jgi:NAD(P)-dependent dehydrogenase (short-subunit alcohol dehydrogenase family)